MAFTVSGFFNLTLKDVWGNDTAVDLLADSLRNALFNSTTTAPNFDTNTAYGAAPFNANEVNWAGTGGSPTAGGLVLASPTLTVTAGNLIFDAADTFSGAGYTFSNVQASLIYDDTIATPVADPALFVLYFAGTFGVTNGVFTVQYHATDGLWKQDHTP